MQFLCKLVKIVQALFLYLERGFEDIFNMLFKNYLLIINFINRNHRKKIFTKFKEFDEYDQAKKSVWWMPWH